MGFSVGNIPGVEKFGTPSFGALFSQSVLGKFGTHKFTLMCGRREMLQGQGEWRQLWKSKQTTRQVSLQGLLPQHCTSVCLPSTTTLQHHLPTAASLGARNVPNCTTTFVRQI